jgi:hypothetical protein
MTMRRDSFAYLMAPGLYKAFFNWLKEHPPIFPKIFNQPPASRRQYEEVVSISGFGVMPTKDEGVSIGYDDMIQGGKKRYTFVVYGLAYRITEEAVDDELYNVFVKASQALSKSARNCVEVYSHVVLNQAFNTAYTGINTGESLCSTSHALIRGGTYANRPATDVDLSLTALQSAVTSFSKIVDEDNMFALITPRNLVIPPDLRFRAREILGSEKKPYTANNEVNAIRDESIGVTESPYLTDTSAWFLMAGKGEHDLNVWWRKKLRLEQGEDFDTGDMKNKAVQRFVSGFGDWRGIYGSSGSS